MKASKRERLSTTGEALITNFFRKAEQQVFCASISVGSVVPEERDNGEKETPLVLNSTSQSVNSGNKE